MENIDNINNLNSNNNFFQKSLLEKDLIKNKKYIGYTCSYIPEEILISGGLDAIRLKGNEESNLADGYLPTNFCPYIKAVWEELYENSNPIPIVFATSCDGMRRLNDIFSTYKKDSASFILDVPKKNDKTSTDYFISRLKKLIEFIEKESQIQKITYLNLLQAIEILNKKRQLLLELTKIYETNNFNLITASNYFSILDLSLSTNNNLFIQDLENYLNYLRLNLDKNKKNILYENDKKIMVIGNYINDMNFWDIFTELNIKVISSDLCLSSRYFEFQINLNDIDVNNNINNNFKANDLLELKNSKNLEDKLEILIKLIAKSYLNKPSCFRMVSLKEKINDIKTKIMSKNIKAVIFSSLKFCDNTLYFYPELKEELIKLNVPSLYLDMDYSNSSIGKIKTRIEAFYEMLF